MTTILNYVENARLDWDHWSGELRGATFSYLRMLFCVWPHVDKLGQPWPPQHSTRRWKRRVFEEDEKYVFTIMTDDDQPVSLFFRTSAPIKRVDRAAGRIRLFLLLDVAFPFVAGVIAVWAILFGISFAQGAEVSIPERDQALQYRYHQAWPSDTR